MTPNLVTSSDSRPRWTPLSISFLGLHIICLAVFWTPFAWPLFVGLVFSYAIRMFAITAGYHRYFSHRTFKLNRISQFLLAFVAQTSAQKVFYGGRVIIVIIIVSLINTKIFIALSPRGFGTPTWAGFSLMPTKPMIPKIFKTLKDIPNFVG